MQAGAPRPEENPSLNIDLKIQQLAISGHFQLSSNPFSFFTFKFPLPVVFSHYFSPPPSAGLKVSRLDMYGEKYKPFKGVKYVTKAGKFQVRT